MDAACTFPRLWPAWLIVVVVAAVAAIAPFAATRTIVHFFGLIGGPILGVVGILLWWVVFSRVRGPDRWWPVLLYLLGAAVVWQMLYAEYPLRVAYGLAPVVAVAWVLWSTVSRFILPRQQRIGLAVFIPAAWAATCLVRIDGMNAEMLPDLRWAWKPSNRDLFDRERHQRHADMHAPADLPPVIIGPGDWPEFRGPNRDGRASGRITANWQNKPPRQLWRIRVGAGWGSFAVVGPRVFTQEQRGDDEAVVCYHASTGMELWEARVPARFTEDISGEGPRATPTVHDSRVYAFGATGRLLALDAATGSPIWSRDICQDLSTSVPQWGFASSPLVVDGLVLVFTAARGKAVAAYRAADGSLAWAAGEGQHGYSSPHRATFHGEPQIIMVSDFGIQAFHPTDGRVLWQREWNLPGQNRVAQPTILPNNELLLGTAVGQHQGAERFRVLKHGELWSTEHVWHGRAPRPYFNDGVVLGQHYYGWDDRNLICLNLRSGKIEWNEGSRFGFGQVLLLEEQKLLLIQTETGPLILAEANPKEFVQLEQLPALNGRTWNHPVVSNGRLYVRNGAEAACYDISEPHKPSEVD